MIYHAHYDEATGKILGFYTPAVHGDAIPTPNVELTEEQWQAAVGGGWMVADGALMEIPPYVPTVEELKERKLAEIAAARFQAETGGVEIQGMRIPTDRQSQGMITGAALQASLDPAYVCQWKTAGGFVTLDAAAILAVAGAVRAHVQAQFDREAELAGAVAVATTGEELDTISWGE